MQALHAVDYSQLLLNIKTESYFQPIYLMQLIYIIKFYLP